MSADNYYAVIKCLDGKHRVYMGFASDDTGPLDLMKHHRCHGEYDTLTDAIDFAHSEYAEYGPYEFDESEEIEIARLASLEPSAKLAQALAAFDEIAWMAEEHCKRFGSSKRDRSAYDEAVKIIDAIRPKTD